MSAQHDAELIAETQGEGATCTILEDHRGDHPYTVFDLEDENGHWIGTLHDGESIKDIQWDNNAEKKITQ